MLLRFGVANHASIHEYSELSLVASEAIKDEGPQLFTPDGIKERILPVVLLYGANASGKTTVYSAIMAMRRHVLNSFSTTQPSAPVRRRPFALTPRAASEPTRFDCDFLLEGVRYHFGFEATDEQFVREWLYYYPGGHRRVLYSRAIENSEIEFGKSLKGKNRSIEDFTRKNSLFLSAAAQNAHAQLSSVFNYFTDKIIGMSAVINPKQIQERVGQKVDARIINFLRLADTGIVGADIKRTPPSEARMEVFTKLMNVLTPYLGDEAQPVGPPDEEIEILFGHAASTSEPVFLDFRTESRGTIRLLDLLNRALSVLDNGGVLLVDELDVSLHTLLAREFIAMFSKSSTNKAQAQLIATTHDTNVLCSPLVRRDQIWFAEKNSVGETHIYPLTKIRTRNTDNIEKGYLQGRFGAIPFLGPVETLLRAE